jgi:hypothetical protein
VGSSTSQTPTGLHDIGYKLCFCNALCGKLWAEHHHLTMVRRCDGLHWPDVVLVWIKWWFIENYPDNVNSDTTIRCSSSHTGSRIFFSLFSVSKIPHQKFGVFRDITHGKKMIQVGLAADKVWWIICGLEFCVVDKVLHKDDMFPEKFHWLGRRRCTSAISLSELQDSIIKL